MTATAPRAHGTGAEDYNSFAPVGCAREWWTRSRLPLCFYRTYLLVLYIVHNIIKKLNIYCLFLFHTCYIHTHMDRLLHSFLSLGPACRGQWGMNTSPSCPPQAGHPHDTQYADALTCHILTLTLYKTIESLYI